MSDVVVVYRRMIAAARKGNGIRLTWKEVQTIVSKDDAVIQAVASADAEDRDRNEDRGK